MLACMWTHRQVARLLVMLLALLLCQVRVEVRKGHVSESMCDPQARGHLWATTSADKWHHQLVAVEMAQQLARRFRQLAKV